MLKKNSVRETTEMPTIYETRTKTGRPHKLKSKRAQAVQAAWRVKEAAARDGLTPPEIREAVKRHLSRLNLSTNTYYSYLNTVMAMSAPLEIEQPVSGQRPIA